MAEKNKVTKFPGVLDPDMNTELYLVIGKEITKTQYDTIKSGYGVTGPDFHIIKKGSKYFLKGDMNIEDVENAVNTAMKSKGLNPVFTKETNVSPGENS